MQISRRDALRGASASIFVIGVPAVTSAVALDNPDAKLFALVDEIESAYREHEEIAAAEFMERRAIEASLPMPPDSIRLGKGDRVSRWPVPVTAGLIEMMRATDIREQPDRSEQIGAHFDRVLDELHAYKSEIDRLRNSPKVRALRARLDELQFRVDELVAEIHDTPARTVAGVLRKVLASYPSGMAPPMMASVAHDLDRLAGEARS